MLSPLNNEVIFKLAFKDKLVFTQFVKDIIGIDFKVGIIETEKRFKLKHSNIDFKMDIFAESEDKRVIIEIQRVAYDTHFDRFLGNFLNTITEQQQSSKNYAIEKEVYSIIILTTPYKLLEKYGRQQIVEDEILIQNLDPENLQGKRINIFGHKQYFLNPYYRKDTTPKPIKDWLDLIYASIKTPENYKLDLKNKGIKQAVKIIDYEKLDSDTIHSMKIANEVLNTQKIDEKIAFKKGEKIGIKKGEEIGIKKGVEIGIKKGEEIGITKMIEIIELIKQKKTDKQISQKTKLALAQIKDIRKLIN